MQENQLITNDDVNSGFKTLLLIMTSAQSLAHSNLNKTTLKVIQTVANKKIHSKEQIESSNIRKNQKRNCKISK